jgi:hypothetical protein
MSKRDLIGTCTCMALGLCLIYLGNSSDGSVGMLFLGIGLGRSMGWSAKEEEPE